MSKSGVGPTLAILAGFLALPGIGRAAVAACTTATRLSAYSGSAGGSASLTNGCTYVDKVFSDFNVSNTTYASVFVQSDAALGDTLNGATGTGVGVADFTSSAFSRSSGNGDTTVAYINYVTTANTGGTVGGYTFTPGTNGYANPPAALGTWAVSSITLNLSAAEIGSLGNTTGDFINIGMAFCLGNNALSTTGSCTEFGGSELGMINIQASYTATGVQYQYDCWALGSLNGGTCDQGIFTINSTGVVTATFASAVTTLSVYNFVDVDHQTGSTAVTLNDLNESFGEEAVPEPSSFALLGLALGGSVCLGAFRKT